jgi:hypothetical protein
VPVGKRGEDKVDAVERSLLEFLEDGIGVNGRQVRMHRPERLPSLALAEQTRRRELRMRSNEPQQLAADIA